MKQITQHLTEIVEILGAIHKLRQVFFVDFRPPSPSGPSLEGEQGERWLPQVFGTYLIGFQKNFLSVDPY